jgi:hypothetical protein
VIIARNNGMQTSYLENINKEDNMFGLSSELIALFAILVVLSLINIQLIRLEFVINKLHKTNMQYQLADLKYKKTKSKLIDLAMEE